MKETIKNLKEVYKYGIEYKISLILQIIGCIIGILINILIPLLSAKFIVNFTNSIWEQAVFMGMVILSLRIIDEFKQLLIRKNTQIFRRGTVRNLQMQLGREILKLDQKTLDSNTSGTFVQRLTNDTDKMAAIFTVGMGYLTGVFSNIGAFIAVLIIDYHMFIYYLSAAIILTYLNIRKTRKYGIKDIEYRKQLDKVSGLTSELVRGARDIKMLNAKDSFMKELDMNIKIQSEKNFDMRNVDINYNLIIGIIKHILEFGAIFLLIGLVNQSIITIALGIALYSYKDNVMTNLMSKISQLLDETKNFNISCTRVFSIVNNKEYKKEVFGRKELQNIDGNFEFKNVSFSYDTNLVLDNINFKINSGETIGFVGKSGSGKTTIFNLLCKMYNVDSGKILIDDTNINELNEKTIRNNITIISQNPYIFNMSIKENLKLVKEDLAEEEIYEVCKLVCLDEYIEKLPNKYDTIVGEGGVNLSGGQKQRLAIARALIQKTKIILFDEATSALDNETQSKIKQTIDNLKGKYTILIIAHRISTIINCDKIMILTEGKIIASGSHKELLKTNKEYKKICATELIDKE